MYSWFATLTEPVYYKTETDFFPGSPSTNS
jgi:hypothetical protein